MKNVLKEGKNKGFYIWFNSKEKEEFFLAPVYKVGDLAKDTLLDRVHNNEIYKRNDNRIADYKLKNNKVNIEEFFIVLPYIERMGELLINFLNTNFSDFNSAYETFYYRYGFELMYKYNNVNRLNNSYASEQKLFEQFKVLHESLKETLISIQSDFKEFVDYIYNLNDNNKDIKYKPQIKFLASILKNRNDINKYNNTQAFAYNYEDRIKNYEEETYAWTLKNLTYNSSLLYMSNMYTSEYLGDICLTILSQVVTNNLKIRVCQNCGKYFIPNKAKEIYCDYMNDNGYRCRNVAPGQTYKKNLENNKALLEYRRTYNQKFNVVSRAKEEDKKKLREEFDKWKKLAQAKVKEYKQEKITENELFKWIMENR